MNVICRDVRFSRDGFTLSADAEFSEGLHIITGKIGSGKSTLASLLAGTIKPDFGKIEKNGISSVILSMQFPEYHLTGATVGSEIASWGLSPQEILKAAGLSCTLDKDPMKLSRGELKRLHLACLLEKDYDLMILDEPFSSLDCIGRKKFVAEMKRIERGVRVIFTHETRILPEYVCMWNISGGVISHVTPEVVR